MSSYIAHICPSLTQLSSLNFSKLGKSFVALRELESFVALHARELSAWSSSFAFAFPFLPLGKNFAHTLFSRDFFLKKTLLQSQISVFLCVVLLPSFPLILGFVGWITRSYSDLVFNVLGSRWVIRIGFASPLCHLRLMFAQSVVGRLWFVP